MDLFTCILNFRLIKVCAKIKGIRKWMELKILRNQHEHFYRFILPSFVTAIPPTMKKGWMRLWKSFYNYFSFFIFFLVRCYLDQYLMISYFFQNTKLTHIHKSFFCILYFHNKYKKIQQLSSWFYTFLIFFWFFVFIKFEKIRKIKHFPVAFSRSISRSTSV